MLTSTSVCYWHSMEAPCTMPKEGICECDFLKRNCFLRSISTYPAHSHVEYITVVVWSQQKLSTTIFLSCWAGALHDVGLIFAKTAVRL